VTEPHPDSDADAAMIDRLYAGSDEGGLQIVRGLVARVREEMPGVEPPAALSARLIQAATPARAGVWTRLRTWFAAIAMHPGLAAAATLVLVAGAAAIWMRQGGKAATPTVSSTPTAPAAEPPQLDDRLEDEELPAQAEVSREADTAEKDVRTPDRSPPSPHHKAKPAPPGTAGGEGSSAQATGDSSPDVVLEAKPPVVVTTKVGGRETAEEKPKQTSPPPPPADDPGATTTTDDDEPNGPPSDAELARQLTRQATTAAKQGDC
jgi:hypothetical protein